MTRSRIPGIAALAVMLLLLAACAGSTPTSAPARPVAGGVSAENPTDGSNGYDDDPSQATASGAPTTDQQLIVYTGTLDLEVTDLRAAIDQADQVITGLGGHIAASDTTETGDKQYATVTYRIPAENWDAALAGLRAVGAKVLNEVLKSEDVTGQVVDLDARIANAKASETALQAIMDRAVTIDDVLDVQRELTTVRGDIESMTAQRDSLANRAQLATLTTTFETAVTETNAATGGWDLGNTIDDALAALVRIGQSLATLAVWALVVVVPVLVPVLILIFVAGWLRRRWLRRRWLRNHPRPGASAGPPATEPTI